MDVILGATVQKRVATKVAKDRSEIMLRVKCRSFPEDYSDNSSVSDSFGSFAL